jgi:hypothetical protein
MLLEQQNKKRLMMQNLANNDTNLKNLVVPAQNLALRAPVSRPSISIEAADGEEVDAAAEKTEAHLRFVEDGETLDRFCSWHRTGIERGAINWEQHRITTTTSVHSYQPIVADTTEIVGGNP